MVGRECGYMYSYNMIRSYLQVDDNDFINNLKLYGGQLLQLEFEDDVIFFLDKEKAKVFINEYLEPLLIAKQLSK